MMLTSTHCWELMKLMSLFMVAGLATTVHVEGVWTFVTVAVIQTTPQFYSCFLFFVLWFLGVFLALFPVHG
jgi:hypothetical protein